MRKYSTIIFVAVCLGVFLVLWFAPPVKTPRLPKNQTHAEFRKYDACPACHLSGSEGPQVATDHVKDGKLLPDHLKCYMCHKNQE